MSVASECVPLRVGERTFMLNRQTLASGRAGVLSRLFASDSAYSASAGARDPEGRVFLDRDGDAFAVIVAFLRTGTAHVPAGVALRRAVDELAYFFDVPPRAMTPRMVRFEQSRAFAGLCSQIDMVQAVAAISTNNWKRASHTADFLRVIIVRDLPCTGHAFIYGRCNPVDAVMSSSTDAGMYSPEVIAFILDVVNACGAEADDARDEYGACLAAHFSATRVCFLPRSGIPAQVVPDEWMTRVTFGNSGTLGVPHFIIEFDASTRFAQSISLRGKRMSTNHTGS